MTKELLTLKTLATIVSGQTHPTQYQCTPREMILHANQDWSLMQQHLYTLQNEGYVKIAPTDTIRFSITEKGLTKLDSAEGKSFGIRRFICL